MSLSIEKENKNENIKNKVSLTLTFSLCELAPEEDLIKLIKSRAISLLEKEVLEGDGEEIDISLNGVKLKSCELSLESNKIVPENILSQDQLQNYEQSPETPKLNHTNSFTPNQSVNKRRMSAIHFANIPDMFSSLLERNKFPLNRKGTNSSIQNKTASGKDLFLDKSEVNECEGGNGLEEKKNNFQSEVEANLNFDFPLSKKMEENKRRETQSLYFKNSNDDYNILGDEDINNTGNILDLLLCDNFKASYESSLTNLEFDSECEHLSRNYKVSILFGNISYSISLYEKAIHFYQKALKLINFNDPLETDLRDENTLHVLHLSVLLNNIGKCHLNLMMVNEGIENFLTALDYINKTHGHKGEYKKIENEFVILKFSVLFNLVDAYYQVENFSKCGSYLVEIFKMIKSFSINRIAMEQTESEVVINLIKYYIFMGKLNFKSNELHGSIENYERCLSLLSSSQEMKMGLMAEIYNNMSVSYAKLGNINKAIEFNLKSFKIYEELTGEDSLESMLSLVNLGHLYQNIKKNKLAFDTLNKAFAISERNKEIDEIYSAVVYRAIGQCYFSFGNELKGLSNYSKANLIYKKFSNVRLISLSEVNVIIQNKFGIISI